MTVAGRAGRPALVVAALAWAAFGMAGVHGARAIERARPMIIAHRGASGLRPEHTLAGYELAIELGADFIEPDVVITGDGVLVVRHENEISGTTDIVDRPEFAGRRTTKDIDGVAITGWFTEDFTLAEMRTLRAKERIPSVRPANTAFDGMFEIPTLQEVIDLARAKSATAGRVIGVYPETKHPSYFAAIGLPLEERLVTLLHANGYTEPDAPVFIQSFEVSNLERLAGMTRLPLVQLLNDGGAPYDFILAGDTRTYADLAMPEGLRAIAGYARAIGPHKNLVIPRDEAGALGAPTSLVADAHAAGLLVHPWTFRDEDVFLPAGMEGDPTAEYALFFALGIDGLFSDWPGTAARARGERR